MPRGVHDTRYQRLLAVLIDARRESGLSQSEVASRLDRPQQFVSRYELSKRRLDIIEYVDVGLVLGLDPPTELAKVLKNN